MKINIEIDCCSDCPKHFTYRAPGDSLCTHPSHGKESKLICHGFIEKGIPEWCPLLTVENKEE
jgi:hypothetical protein